MRISCMMLLVILLGACGGETGGQRKAGASTNIRYARHFNIIEHEGFTELQLLQPETGKLEVAFALVKAENQAGVPADLIRIRVPVKNMAVLSTTHIGMLSALKATSCIRGTTGEAYISNPAVRKGIKSGKVKCFPDEAAMSPENLLTQKIKLVMYSGFGKPFPHSDKLVKLGIITMPNYDWREEHPLGKAEWIKVFGYLTGQPEKAMNYFNKVERTYNETKAAIAKVKSRPKVLVGSLIGSIWYAPAGKSYMATILKDAGADYIYHKEPGTGSCRKNLEEVYIDQLKVDYWINAGAVSRADLLGQQSKYGLFESFKKGQVYCYTWNSNYFWEMGAVNPHWLLEDFAAIIGTNRRQSLHFYQKLK